MAASATSFAAGYPGACSPGCPMTSGNAMTGRLRNKVALVTGGSRGIGAAIVLAFAREGADVIFCHDGDEEGAASVAEAAGPTGQKIRNVSCDVSDQTALRQFWHETERDFAAIDILVNNAGISGET